MVEDEERLGGGVRSSCWTQEEQPALLFVVVRSGCFFFALVLEDPSGADPPWLLILREQIPSSWRELLPPSPPGEATFA